MDTLQRGLCLTLIVAGIGLWDFFGFGLGLVLAGTTLAVLVYLFVRDRRFVGATLVVFLSAGMVWIPPLTMNRQPEIPPIETAAAAANDYARTLAAADLDSYRVTVDHVYGVTIEEAFGIESQCIDWGSATVSVAPHEISPLIAVVTFSDGSSSVVRDFAYQWTKDLFQRFTGRWVPVVEDSC